MGGAAGEAGAAGERRAVRCLRRTRSASVSSESNAWYAAGPQERGQAVARAGTIGEETLPSGWRALRLRNEHLEVLLLPEKGSEIYALRSLPHGVGCFS